MRTLADFRTLWCMCSKGSCLENHSEDGDILELTWLAVLFDVKTFPLIENSQVCLLAHGCMWYRHAQVSTGQKIPKRAQTIDVAVTFIWLWWRLLDLSEVYGGHGFSIVLQRFFNTSQCILILLRNKILQQLIASIAWKWRHVLNMVKL